MKSPFPGVDPYLEQHWSDVHQQPPLPPDLAAWADSVLRAAGLR